MNLALSESSNTYPYPRGLAGPEIVNFGGLNGLSYRKTHWKRSGGRATHTMIITHCVLGSIRGKVCRILAVLASEGRCTPFGPRDGYLYAVSPLKICTPLRGVHVLKGETAYKYPSRGPNGVQRPSEAVLQGSYRPSPRMEPKTCSP
jgi:hypothetical protein